MSDIAGPPAPKEIPSQIRGADKTAHVAKDPNSENTRTGGQSHEQAARDQGEALHSRDPAVSIASSAAHLVSGQEITEPVTRIDAEGRPIIVTETVTLALKPDAGLKPNDTVQLKVVDAGKQVTADLLRQNSVAIDPPIRLLLTVIEVHIANPQQETKNLQEPSARLDTPYHSSIIAKNTAANVALTAAEQSTKLSALISDKSAIPYSPVKQTEAQLQMPVTTTSATRHGVSIASSADLATLIQQQTGAHPEQQNSISQTPTAPTTVPKAPATARGPEVATSRPSPATGPGIGPALSGVSLSGAPAIIQLLDPAISTVSPADVASVKNVQTVTAAEARALPIGASTFGSGDAATAELAKVDTTHGQFILPAAEAVSLAGELVRVAVGAEPVQSRKPATEQTIDTKFRALFIENTTGARPAKVDVTLIGKPIREEAKPGNSAVITSVQTVAAFFGADGPKTDLRLQTSRGDISLTVPSGVRPQPGDSIGIIVPNQGDHSAPRETVPPRPSQPSTPAAPPQSDARLATPEIAPTSIAQAASAGSMPGAPNILASWPAMEESLAALLGTNAAAATSLAGKTAQGGSKLANSLMFFLKAAGMAGSPNWIGNDVEKALSRSSQLALGSLRSDINQMASLAGETIGEWRPILLPFDARGGDVPLAALLLGQRPDVDPDAQHDNSDPTQRDNDDTQRFILQVQFSVLGDIQLDGSISKQSFDLTVRSKNDLPTALQQDASALFYDALAANNFTGVIDFRQRETFSVDAAALIEGHLRGNRPG